MRIDYLEFRHMPERDAEIVCWNKTSDGKEYCYTLMFFIRGKEGHDIHFVGDRPFNPELNYKLLWKLMKYGQTVLDAELDLENDV